MELKSRYKNTEVGVIPEDWTLKAIGSIASVCAGGTPSRRVSEYWNGSIPWVTTTELNADTISETTQCISELGLKNSAAKLIDSGAILLALYGQGKTRGKVALLEIQATTNQACAAISVSSRVCPRFIFHNLASQYKAIRGLSNSGSQENLSGGIVKGILVALPPTKAEQEAIAEVLSAADILIESLDQLLGKKRKLKQGVMQELLSYTRRLPGFTEEWQLRPLEKLADIRSGGTPSTTRPEFWDGDVLWCTPTDITGLNGVKYLTDTSRKITELGLKSSSAGLIPPNSIVMTSRATIGECAINRVAVSTNQGFKNFVPFEHVDVDFLYYLLTMQKQRFVGLCSGSTFLEIGKTQLRGYEVRIPAAKEEQTAIASVLSDMDTEIADLDAKLTKARQIKQGMMQELLTGRIRLV